MVSEEKFNGSNLCVIGCDNNKESIECLVNKYKKNLFDMDNGECLVSDYIVDPYYFEFEVDDKSFAEKLNAQKTIVLVPSLALIRQIVEEWKKETNGKLNRLCVCSAKDTDNNENYDGICDIINDEERW